MGEEDGRGKRVHHSSLPPPPAAPHLCRPPPTWNALLRFGAPVACACVKHSRPRRGVKLLPAYLAAAAPFPRPWCLKEHPPCINTHSLLQSPLSSVSHWEYHILLSLQDSLSPPTSEILKCLLTTTQGNLNKT